MRRWPHGPNSIVSDLPWTGCVAPEVPMEEEHAQVHGHKTLTLQCDMCGAVKKLEYFGELVVFGKWSVASCSRPGETR